MDSIIISILQMKKLTQIKKKFYWNIIAVQCCVHFMNWPYVYMYPLPPDTN